MRKIILYISFILLFCSCETRQQSDGARAVHQTTLMYMTGTDLSMYFNNNISAAKRAIAAGDLNGGRFIVFRHNTSSTGALVEYKMKDGKCVNTTLKSYDNITSLSQEAIIGVIADLKRFAPALSYNLIISGHATGWVLKSRQTNTWLAPGTSDATAPETVDWQAMLTSPIVTRYLGSTNDKFFDISELKESLDAADTHFNTIIFDECFMSSIEALYDLRNNCNYIIASPCEIMGPGFPYATVIPKLYANKGQNIDHQGVCKAFYDYYESYTYPSGCIALTVTSELEALAETVKAINLSSTNKDIDLAAIQDYERLKKPIFYDLEQYMLAKCTDKTLANEFKAQMALAFPVECRLHTERFFANIGARVSNANNYEAYYSPIEYYSGVTTSAPSEQMSSEWSETEWSKIIY